MSRALVLALGALLALPLSSRALAPAPLRPARAGLPVGRWIVAFTNGVVETCEGQKDGRAFVSEPARASPGTAEIDGFSVVVRFQDDRVERWTRDGKQYVVEHWFPASAFPAGAPVRGVARPIR